MYKLALVKNLENKQLNNNDPVGLSTLSKEAVDLTLYYDETTARGKTATQIIFGTNMRKMSVKIVSPVEAPKIKDLKAHYDPAVLYNVMKASKIKEVKDKIMVPMLIPLVPEDNPIGLTALEIYDQRKRDNQLSPGEKSPLKVFPIIVPLTPASKAYFRPTSYIPKYKAPLWDKELYYNSLERARSGLLPEVVANLIFDELKELREVVEKFYFGNGSMEGQLGRHAAVLKVVSKIKGWAQTRGTQHTIGYDAWRDLMDRRRPLAKVDFSLTAFEAEDPDKRGTMKWYSAQPGNLVFKSDLEGKPLLKIANGSDSGILWGEGAKIVERARTTGVDLDYANVMYGSLAILGPAIKESDIFAPEFNPDGTRKPITEVTPQDLKNFSEFKFDMIHPRAKAELFWQIYEHARLLKFKPKAEVYDVADFHAKTRNISVTNACSLLMAQIILRRPAAEAPNFLDDDEIWSMSGFSIYHGGMDKLVKRMQRAAIDNKPLLLVYADNFYCLAIDENGKWWWISADGEKMEASITGLEVGYEGRRSVESFKAYDEPYMLYATKVLPSLSVGMIGCIGPRQIYMPYMSSGTQGTAAHNSNKTIRLVDHLTNSGKRFPKLVVDKTAESGYTLSGLLQSCKYVGTSFKVELATELDSILEFETEGLAVKRVDVLGYDLVECSTLGLPGSYIGVLDKIRLLKALGFYKTNLEKLKYRTLIRTIKFMRLRTLYLAGGWAYLGIAEMIRLQCSLLKREITNENDMVDLEEFKEWADSMSLSLGDDEQTLRMFIGYAIPTMYEVVRLHLDGAGEAKNANAFALYAIKYLKEPYNYMPFEVYTQIIEDYKLDIDNDDIPAHAVIASYEEGVYKERVIPLTQYVKVKYGPQTKPMMSFSEVKSKGKRLPVEAMVERPTNPAKIPEKSKVVQVTAPTPTEQEVKLDVERGQHTSQFVESSEETRLDEMAVVLSDIFEKHNFSLSNPNSQIVVRLTRNAAADQLKPLSVLYGQIATLLKLPQPLVRKALRRLNVKDVVFESAGTKPTFASSAELNNLREDERLKSLVEEVKSGV